MSASFHMFMQDPDHILTGEGNVSGTVDPKLALWAGNKTSMLRGFCFQKEKMVQWDWYAFYLVLLPFKHDMTCNLPLLLMFSMVNLYCMSLHLGNWVEILTVYYLVLLLSDEEVVCCLLIDACHVVQKIIGWSLGPSTWCPTPFTTHSCGAQDKVHGSHMNVWWGKVLGAPRDGVPPLPNNYLVRYISSCMLHTCMVPPIQYGVT